MPSTTLGQAAHEFISPLVHDYQGDRDALQAFFQGYGLPPEKWSHAWQNHLMARIAIYYAAYLPHYLAAVPQLTPRQRWEELAMEFCQLSEPGEYSVDAGPKVPENISIEFSIPSQPAR